MRDEEQRLNPETENTEQKDSWQMSVSEILHDEDWGDADEYVEPKPYHRHVRIEHQRREHRLWVRIIRKLGALIAFIIVICLVLIFGFHIRKVIVTGNYAYSDEEILNFLHYNESPKNSLYFTWKNRNGVSEGIPFIEMITVHLAGPSTINVSVVEKMIIGCIDDNGVYMFLDNTGVVVESSTERAADVPLITGLNLAGLQIGEQLDLDETSVFNNLHELSVFLRNYELTVDQIDYNTDQSMVLHKGSISILLGMGTNLEDKINAYKDLEPSLEGLSGKLHLEDYDSTKKRIFFSKE